MPSLFNLGDAAMFLLLQKIAQPRAPMQGCRLSVSLAQYPRPRSCYHCAGTYERCASIAKAPAGL